MFGKFRSKSSTTSSKKLSKSKSSSIESKTEKSFNKRAGTSGSDVSVIRNENMSNAQNRNSSSG